MNDAALFSVLSKCFAPVDEGEWKRLTANAAWAEFLDAARSALQDERVLGADELPAHRSRLRCPLQDFLAAVEVDALFSPPTFAEKQSFAARHFTGGLPASVVPVESLYARLTRGNAAAGGDAVTGGAAASRTAAQPWRQPQREGGYWGEPAQYMRALIGRLGLEVPPQFAACPDHLALELDLVAVLLRSGMYRQAQTFLVERFAWLTAYRRALLALSDADARFYVALVDVLAGIAVRQSSVAASA